MCIYENLTEYFRAKIKFCCIIKFKGREFLFPCTNVNRRIQSANNHKIFIWFSLNFKSDLNLVGQIYKHRVHSNAIKASSSSKDMHQLSSMLVRRRDRQIKSLLLTIKINLQKEYTNTTTNFRFCGRLYKQKSYVIKEKAPSSNHIDIFIRALISNLFKMNTKGVKYKIILHTHH